MWFIVSRRKFSIEQIAAALRQAQAGMPEAELLRQLGISASTFSRWKKVYGGAQPGGARVPAVPVDPGPAADANASATSPVRRPRMASTRTRRAPGRRIP